MIPKISFAGKAYLTKKVETTCDDEKSKNEIKYINHYAHEFDCDVVVFNKQETKPYEASKYDAYCYTSEVDAPERRTFVVGAAGIEGISAENN